jgi:hypothetical protein
MTSFEVQCMIGEDRVCIEIPTDCSVGDVMKKVSEVTGKKGVSIWSCDILLNCEHLFADHFEPEATYVVKVDNDFPEGSLMLTSSDKLEGFGIDLTNAKLLMDVKGRFKMGEFETKVVKAEVNPTLLLLAWKRGFVIGGLAGVPWPKVECRTGQKRYFAADPEKKSFIFSLEPTARRFDVVKTDKALLRMTGVMWRSFQFANDLIVYDDGDCAGKTSAYAGERDDGSFPGFTPGPFTRFELWAL